MPKVQTYNNTLIGSKMFNAIKRACTKFHPWGFYKDENNYDLIANDLIDISDPNQIRKVYGKNMTQTEAEVANEFVIVSTEIAYALNLGFKIKFTKDMLLIFNGAFYDDAMDLISINNDNLDSLTIQDIMNYICINTNISELIKWIVENANVLANVEKFGMTRYFIYTTDIFSGYNASINYRKGSRDINNICPIYSISIDGNYVIISMSNYNCSKDIAMCAGSRIIARVLDDGNVQITSNIWHNIKDKKDLIMSMHSDCYGALFLLSNIHELLIRDIIKGIPQKEYKYTIDHNPSSIMKDGKVHYTKYEEHLTTNPYYPHDRKSPRLHVVSGYYKKNGTWVDSYVRGTDDELMSYINEVLDRKDGDNDMSKNISNDQIAKIAPIIEEELRTTKGKDKYKIIANKYKLDQGLIRSIGKTRKTGLDKFIPNNTTIDITNNNSVVANTDNKPVEEPIQIEYKKEEIDTVDNNKQEIQIKDSRGRLTDDARLLIAELFEDGMSKEDISAKFDIHITTVRKIIIDLCGNIDRKKKVYLSEDDKKKVVELYTSGENSIATIASQFNVSQSTITSILKREGVGDGTIMKNRSTNYSNLNAHQYKKKMEEEEKKYLANNAKEIKSINKKKIIISTANTDVKKEKKIKVNNISEIIVDNNNIVFAGGVFEDSKISTITNTVTIGMVSDRHDIGNIGYLFKGPLTNEQLNDFGWQESVVDNFIDNNFNFDNDGNAEKYLTLYCTGIQVILASIIRVCIRRHVNLLLKHYSSSDSEYISQPMINMYGEQKEIMHPFKKLEKSGKIYLYNTKLEDIINAEFFGISLNVHEDDSIKFKSGKCAYIFFRSEADAWELYPKFVRMIQSNIGKERNSVLLTAVKSNGESFVWGDNISKSYNFK